MTHSPMKTPSAFAHKLAYLQSRAWLPPALLLLALSSVFLFGGDQRGYFYRAGTPGEMSSKNMAIAENLSIEHNFVMFRRQVLHADGETTLRVYSRFPIGSYALIKLATLPFGDSLSAKIYAARMLMLLFFVAAAFTAYLALRRLASNRWIALTATLLAFSSPFCLYYGDVISGEAIVDIFAVLLVFHGMAVFEQEGRFRQLAVKTCAALLLGWHAYALLLPFIAFGLMRELVRSRLDGSVPPIALRQLKHTALSLLRSRYLALGVIALAFGVSMLTLNFTSEYFASNRETPLTELPSVRSMLNRTGVDSTFAENYGYHLHWPVFLERQFHRVGATFLPYAFSPPFVDRDHNDVMLRLFVITGIAAFVASLIGLLLVRRYTMLWATLAISGFCWALPMRNSVASPSHHFEALFYIGVALTLFTIILLCLRRLAGERLVAALSVAAMLIFAFSALRMSQLVNSIQTAELAELQEAAVADFEVIRSATDGKAVLINSMPGLLNRERQSTNYYFSRRPILYGYETILYGYETMSLEHSLDFIVTGARADGLASLTPQNQTVFLYEWNEYHSHITETIAQADEPQISSGFFDVYLNGNSLIYVKDDCGRGDADNDYFFLSVRPANIDDLPIEYRRYGFQNLEFGFRGNGVRQSEDRCIATTPLPDYDIARIHTGQHTQGADGSSRYLWRGEIFPSNPLINVPMERINETIAQAGEPQIQSDFDVYLNYNALIYVKDNCGRNDIDSSFSLAAYPVDEIDLPEGSRQYGFQNLGFGFRKNGIRQADGRCVALVRLPDYDIDRISTGQYIYGADGETQLLWKGEVFPSNPLINMPMERINEIITQAGAPQIQSDFDVYLSDDALIYVKDDCGRNDIDSSFSLAAYPVDEIDLPEGSRQYGFQNLGFGFRKNGIRQADGRCVALVRLPDYDIAHISTAQYIRGADGEDQRLWRGKIHLPDPLINDRLKDIDETIAQAGEPIIQSDFDVYLNDDALIYVKDGCSENDTDASFFLAAYPVDENALPVESRQYGFQNLEFGFQGNGVRQSDERCVALALLPDYDIARISTGQYIRRANGETQHLWKGKVHLPDRLINERLKDIDETIAQAGEPIIRSDFDVYLNDDALIYVKDDCGMSDTDASFFLALFPVDENALPAESRQYGFQNLDFGFQKNGIRRGDDRCIAIAQLPDYDIARISTGQYTRGADGSTEHLWNGEFRPTEASR